MNHTDSCDGQDTISPRFPRN